MGESTRVIDLRRDTITLPSDRMREEAFRAPLGDSVYGEDPKQEELEEYAARLLGKQGAIFVPSGTMGNLIALLSFTGRGDEVILEENAHIRNSETGGAACVGGLMLRGVPGPEGVPDPGAIERAVRADDIHYPRTALICLENTHYRYGGLASGPERLARVKRVAEMLGVPVHLDGARLFNAAVALGVEARELARHSDSVMVSLSKGLGAPVGSVLCGTSEFIKRARRYRKMLGGGMRQTGWLASCGLIALSEENIARLGEDHKNARLLAEGISRLPGFAVNLTRTHTNFVLARIEHPSVEAKSLLAQMESKGVLAMKTDEKTLRFVTSSRVTQEDVRYAVGVIGELVRARAG
jgi:threonine aldolase